MAATVRTVLILDGGGSPNESATPTVVKYVAKNGAARTAPAIINVGGGEYSYSPTDADEAIGTVALIDCGAGLSPRYVTEAIFKADQSNQFWAWHLVDPLETLWTGAAPTVGVYKSKLGVDRPSTPSVNDIETYLFTLTPTESDVTTQTVARIDAPSGAYPAYFDASTNAYNAPYIDLEATTGIDPEGLAIRALREWLLRALPAKTAELNLYRNATLRAPGIGPFAIPSGASLKVSATSLQGAWTTVPLTSGTRTATQLAADVTTAAPSNVTSGVDGSGYFYVTSDVEPSASGNLNSFMGVGSDSTGANLAIGWEAGGEHVLNPPLRPPSFRGVTDGHPVTAPDMGKGMWVILGDRSTVMYQNNSYRRDEYETTISVEVYRPDANQNPNRNREAISSTVRAIRECLMSDTGKQLGRASAGDIVFAKVINTKISSRPFSFEGSNSPNVFFDVALLTVAVRTFQRPVTAAQN